MAQKRSLDPPPSFEASLEKLESIIEAIEAPDIALDASLALYKEGIALAKTCGEVLTRYEEEVQTLQKDADGVFTTVPFGPGPILEFDDELGDEI